MVDVQIAVLVGQHGKTYVRDKALMPHITCDERHRFVFRVTITALILVVARALSVAAASHQAGLLAIWEGRGNA